MAEKAKKPLIRFKGFTEAWEQRELDELSFLITKQTGFDYSATIKPALLDIKNSDTFSFIQNKDFCGTKINYETDFYIPKSVAKDFPKITIDCPCLLVSISGKIGNIAYCSGDIKAFIGGAVGICKLKNKDIGLPIVFQLESDKGQSYIQSLTKASSHSNITVEDIRKMTVNLSKSESENLLVGQFFNNLDNLITLHQRQENLVKNIAKTVVKCMYTERRKNDI